MKFRTCSGCQYTWSRRTDFLEDPEVALVGYQVNFDRLEAGHFLFNHLSVTCGSTISVHAQRFVDLYKGPMFEERMRGTKACPGYCLHETELKRCAAKCECAFVREILNLIRNWDKRRPDQDRAGRNRGP